MLFSSHDDGVLTVSAMTKMMINLILIPFFTWINPLTPKMLVERVLVMLVKFGGVEPYLLGKSGLARDRRVLKHGKSTANSIVNYLHPQAGEIIFNS